MLVCTGNDTNGSLTELSHVHVWYMDGCLSERLSIVERTIKNKIISFRECVTCYRSACENVDRAYLNNFHSVGHRLTVVELFHGFDNLAVSVFFDAFWPQLPYNINVMSGINSRSVLVQVQDGYMRCIR